MLGTVFSSSTIGFHHGTVEIFCFGSSLLLVVEKHLGKQDTNGRGVLDNVRKTPNRPCLAKDRDKSGINIF
jgi:hypothetical protein